MKITVLTAGTIGDILPYQQLGQELIARGHAVRITASQQLQRLDDGVTEIYPVLDPYTLGPDEASKTLLQSGGGTNFVKQMRLQGEARVSTFLDQCTDACRGADLILYANLGFAGPHIGEAMGIPFFAVPLSPTLGTACYPALNLPDARICRGLYNRLSHTYAEQLFWRQVGPVVNRWRRRSLQMKAIQPWGPFKRIKRTGYPFVYLISEPLFPRPIDWPQFAHLAGFHAKLETEPQSEHQRLLDFALGGSPPIVFAFGPTWSYEHNARMEACVAASRATGVRALICDPTADEQYQELDRDVSRVGFAPFPVILPKALAVFHHGGAGTTYMCVRSQVPCASFPMFGDQFIWTKCLQRLNCGPKPLLRDSFTETALVDLIKEFKANEQTYRNNLHTAAEQLRQETPAFTAANLIEQAYDRTHVARTIKAIHS